MEHHDQAPATIILGAGIAGLATAYFLKQQGISALVLEKSSTYGGLARSFRWHGFTCDFSAHRFFTHDLEVLNEVRALVPMHQHERRSQIYLHGQWMSDPVDVIELAKHLPMRDTSRLVAGYLLRDRGLPEESFEHLVLKRYGAPFHELFFRSYTERLFTLPAHQIAVEWARRKVRLASPFDRFKRATKTKFSSFYYPVAGGYGAIADALYGPVEAQVHFGARVTGFECDGDGSITHVCYDQDGQRQRAAAAAVVSSLPLTLTAKLLGVEVALEYQKVDAVYLLLDQPQMTPNHWLYFMDRESAVNRLVEFKHMSDVDTDPRRTVVCAEVTRPVIDPGGAVIDDLIRCGLIRREEVIDSMVIHEPFAYPRYSRGYGRTLAVADEQLRQHRNLHLLGRAAQFDHFEVDDLIGGARGFVNSYINSPTFEGRAAESLEPPLVAIVVLAWNNYDDTAECLRSLKAIRYPNYRVIVVDNGSTDGTPDLVRHNFPEVTVLENGANLGVPKGYNVGFRHALRASATWVFMLNNDTIVDPEIIDQMLAATTEPAVGVVHPAVFFYDRREEVWSAGARYRRLLPAIVMERRLFPPGQGFHELEYAISCGLLISRRTFEEAGLFDENYRFLWDDLDFSERVRAHGLKIVQAPGARMWHKVSRTTQPGSALFWQVHGESGAIFHRRHRQFYPLTMAIHLGYFAIREFGWKRRWHFFKPFLTGLRTGLTRPLSAVPQIKDDVAYPR